MAQVKSLKILFVTSEVVPFVKTGGLADVSSALPQKLQELGHQVRIVVPKYGSIDERKYKIHEVVRLKDLTTTIGKKEVVYSLRSSFLVGSKARVQIYFLDNEEYFGSRNSLYYDPLKGTEYKDNDERFILLSKSVFELIEKLGWVPDVIHLNDWQTALVPAFQKTIYKDNEVFQNIKTLLTIHNIGQQGVFPKTSFTKTGLPEEFNNNKVALFNDKFNFLRTGLKFADKISTVSESYANDICNIPEISLGLVKEINSRKDDLYGIINGIDTLIWNPEKDKKIAKKFSAANLKNKMKNKEELADKFDLKFNAETPIIGMISRLEDNKGFDLFKQSFKQIMALDVQLVLLGTGDKKYHKFFEDAEIKYVNKFACYLGFDDVLAHLIEAGSDMFLMPSKYEPCGLNQMYSLAYGTIPIVRKTGGLADTVEDYNDDNKKGNGFVFTNYESKDLLFAIERAISLFQDKKAWERLMKTGMKINFSWLNSAKNYVNLYKNILK
ncbi:MAG: glycogen synthase GlgA [Bacteroidetes bacterium]|nr:glycogen synthase GlgA [Bacteroidota bacterium]MBU1113864.1 glycogen synthase GlgA [Bacteroidota bacterium]MBU1798110.1 glycogen synthase GlgA [Bacteroidota bacterium]